MHLVTARFRKGFRTVLVYFFKVILPCP
jgi:hypothetical protein